MLKPEKFKFCSEKESIMKKELTVNQTMRYLCFPIAIQGELCTVSIYSAGQKIHEFRMPVTAGEEKPYLHDFSAYLPISPDFWGKLSLEGDFSEAFAEAVTAAQQTEAAEAADKTAEEPRERPCIHFTPASGWINDPNGLIYHKGIYHLYYQYNPFHVEWGNMSWGHAVSTDLLHWKHCDAVLFPDEEGVIYSGSAIENEHSLLGLPEDALLYFYTSAGNVTEWNRHQPYVQKLAYSSDYGYTLRKLQTAVSEICAENRDPKVFWHKISKAYIMCLWLEKNDFAILRSTDLEHWEMSQRLTLQEGFECPNLFELYAEDGTSQWIFWTADGYYFQGRFDGWRFESDGVRREAYCGGNLYAAQIFSGIEDRVIMVPWFRTSVQNKCYRGAMGIPQELYLGPRDGEQRICMRPVREYGEQRRLIHHASAIEMYQNAIQCGSRYSYYTEYREKQMTALEVFVICSSTVETVTWNLFGTLLRYEASAGLLYVENTIKCIMQENQTEEYGVETAEVYIGEHRNVISVILDCGLLEINCDYVKIYAAELEMTKHAGCVRISSDGLCRVEMYTLSQTSHEAAKCD